MWVCFTGFLHLPDGERQQRSVKLLCPYLFVLCLNIFVMRHRRAGNVPVVTGP